MGARRQAREIALQLLYEFDLARQKSAYVLGRFAREPLADFYGVPAEVSEQDEIKSFAHQLASGVLDHLQAIDALLESQSAHWKLSRMSCVDRNILRLATFELLYCPDIPASVTLNEAIEIAKKFGSEDSGAFVNGVLDPLAHKAPKAEVMAGSAPGDENG